MKTTEAKHKFFMVIAGLLTLLVALPLSAAEPLQHWRQKLEQSTLSGTVLVANSDAIIFHQSFGLADRENLRAFAEETVFDIGSVTKQFTATAIMLLVEQGKLSLSATIDNYFANVPADKQGITIHHLLTHSSGLRTNPPRFRLYDIVENDVYTSQMLKQKLVAQPGETFHYSNIGYSLLAQLIEIASGQNWEAYIQQNILLPAGLTETSWQEMFEKHVAENAAQTFYYGYGWAIDNQNGLQRINHSGSNGYSYSTFDYYPEIDLFIFTASNDLDNYPRSLMKEIKESMQQMVANKSIQPTTNLSAD